MMGEVGVKSISPAQERLARRLAVRQRSNFVRAFHQRACRRLSPST
jgi:hypothetical protein